MRRLIWLLLFVSIFFAACATQTPPPEPVDTSTVTSFGGGTDIHARKLSVSVEARVLPFSSAGFVKNAATGVLSGGNSVDVSDDTNLAVALPITLSGDTVGLGSVTEVSTDGTLGDNSDTAIPTEKATKTYVDAAVAGISADKITEGDTEVETVDAGDGYILFTEDGSEVGRWTGATFVAGTGANTLTFDPASGPTWAGTGRPTRYIEIKPDGLCPSDSDTGTGTGTLAYDETNLETYFRWQSSGTDQTYDFGVAFFVDAEFSAWIASNPISIRVRTNDITNATMVVSMYQNDDTVDSTINASSILPSGNDTWEVKSLSPGGTYAAGDLAKLKFTLQGDAADQCDVGMIRLDYLAAY